jgi:hypothetical protein
MVQMGGIRWSLTDSLPIGKEIVKKLSMTGSGIPIPLLLRV